jgi:hypothetical protein
MRECILGEDAVLPPRMLADAVLRWKCRFLLACEPQFEEIEAFH